MGFRCISVAVLLLVLVQSDFFMLSYLLVHQIFFGIICKKNLMNFTPEFFFDARGSGTLIHQQPSILLLINICPVSTFHDYSASIDIWPVTFCLSHCLCIQLDYMYTQST